MITPGLKVFFGALSIAFTLASRVGYFTGVLRGRARPHLFTWIIWTTISCIGFAAQVAEGAGPGSWARGFGSATSFMLVGIAFYKGSKEIKPADWLALGAALCAIPLWAVTKTPFWSVLIVCSIDSLGYIPTVRKSWSRPWAEPAFCYLLSCLAAFFSLLAIKQYTPSTWLYPLMLTLTNGAMWIFLNARGRALERAGVTG